MLVAANGGLLPIKRGGGDRRLRDGGGRHGGIVVAASDFWPKWHAKSGKLLGIGTGLKTIVVVLAFKFTTFQDGAEHSLLIYRVLSQFHR